jgi:Ca2+-binding RTX toxin-like protein
MRRTILLVATMALTLMVASGVALAITKIGTDGHDTLKGTKGSDTLVGRGGNDRIYGRGGEDVILGGRGNEDLYGLYGGPGADVISGGPGRDYVFGGGGPDVLKGGLGNDWVDAQGANWMNKESAVDLLSGGGGKDFFTAFTFPAALDIVRCGAGRDRAIVDSKDMVADDCETVRVPNS